MKTEKFAKQSIDNHGRALVATCDIELGQTILVESPFAYMINDHLIATNCSFCLGRMTKKFRCAGCKCVHYCSDMCQKHDWKEHKSECVSIKKVHPNIATQSIRMMSRILSNRCKDPTSTQYEAFRQLVSRIHSLNSLR